MLDRTYEPDGYQEVEAAFRVLDTKGVGYLEEEELHKLLCKGNEWGLRCALRRLLHPSLSLSLSPLRN
jgi:hypothetical protein